jgi:hypothetical protein
LSNEPKQRGTKLGRADGLSARHGTHSGDDVRSRGVWQQISRYTRTDGIQELFCVGFHSYEDGLKSGASAILERNTRREPSILARVGHKDITLGLEYLRRGSLASAALADY